MNKLSKKQKTTYMLFTYTILLIGLILSVALFWLYPINTAKIPFIQIKSPSQTSTKTITFALISPENYSNENVKIIQNPEYINSVNDFDSALAFEFAKKHNSSPIFKYFANQKEFESFLESNPEVIGIGISENNLINSSSLLLSQAYRYSEQVLIAHKKNTFSESFLAQISSNPSIIYSPKNNNLSQNIIINVSENNPNINDLSELAKQYPQILIKTNTLTTFELGKYLTENPLELAKIEKNQLSILQMLYPNIEGKLVLNINTPMVWVVSDKNKNLPQEKNLINLVNQFFDDYRTNGKMAALAENYSYDLNRLDNLDLQYFYKRVSTKLLPLLPLYKAAAKATNQPWTLLAALSYQESQWVADAVSTTGARGLMMINEITAEQLNIEQNDDPKTQIMAGAKYLKKLREDLEFIPEDDRTLIALCAYNIGGGGLSQLIRSFIKPSAQPSEVLEPAGKYITVRLTKSDWQSVIWGNLRNYILEQSLKGRASSQPVVLTERIRIFQSLLEEMEKNKFFEKKN